MERSEKEEKYTYSEEFVALSDFTADGPDQLSLKRGDRLVVLSKPCEDWWWAELQGDEVGYVPAGHLLQCCLSTSNTGTPAGTGQGPQEQQEEDLEVDLADPWQDEEYFGSYGSLKLHLEMLSDRSRTEAYRQTVLNNLDFLKDKVVMDLGCGTGIISLFCAQLAQPAKISLEHCKSCRAFPPQEHMDQPLKENLHTPNCTVWCMRWRRVRWRSTPSGW